MKLQVLAEVLTKKEMFLEDCFSTKMPRYKYISYIDGLVQEGCNSSALAMELRLSCTNPSI